MTQSDGWPTVFEFSLAGFGGPSCVVQLRGDCLVYETFRPGHVRDAAAEVRPDAAAWQRFWAALERLGVWRWRSEYSSSVYDGRQWALEIEYGGKHLAANGSNAYPDALARVVRTVEPTPTFRAFERAVSELLGGLEVA